MLAAKSNLSRRFQIDRKEKEEGLLNLFAVERIGPISNAIIYIDSK